MGMLNQGPLASTCLGWLGVPRLPCTRGSRRHKPRYKCGSCEWTSVYGFAPWAIAAHTTPPVFTSQRQVLGHVSSALNLVNSPGIDQNSTGDVSTSLLKYWSSLCASLSEHREVAWIRTGYQWRQTRSCRAAFSQPCGTLFVQWRPSGPLST